VALARALVKHPRVLLLDEPLSALDAKLREQMRQELVRLRRTIGITFVIVTHDQSEALSMADRIAVMDDGRVSQIAAPAELYEHPANRFVAAFIGRINLFAGRSSGVIDDGAGRRLVVDSAELGRVAVPLNGHGLPAGGVSLGVRPEKLRLDRASVEDGRIRLRGRVAEIAYFGETSHITLDLEGGGTVAMALSNATRAGGAAATPGEALWASWDAKDMVVMEG
jgi:ABC-type Fe3+/spermidine/putrescine transport system ATPase subunit